MKRPFPGAEDTIYKRQRTNNTMGAEDSNWPSYPKCKVPQCSTIATRWKNMQGQLTKPDITFLVGPNKTQFQTYKCILVSSSVAFDRMLSNGMFESTAVHIPIGDHLLTPASFQIFLNYATTGEAVISGETVFGVLDLAQMYFFPKLASQCKIFLKKTLTIDNSLSIFRDAELWHFEDISDLALAMISSKTLRAISQVAFNSLSLPAMLKIVQHPNLNIEEIDLFKQTLNWYRQNQREENRQVFTHIRYGRISNEDLHDHVGPANVISPQLFIQAWEHSLGHYTNYPDVISEPRKQVIKHIGRLCYNHPEIVEEIRNKRAFTIANTVTTLNLSYSNINSAGAQHLCDALKTNKIVTSLDLQGNYIGANGAQQLREVLHVNNTLKNLTLNNTKLGECGARYLCEALKENKSLLVLDLQGNNIGDNGAQCLYKALQTNNTLTSLHLAANNIGVIGIQSLCEALKTNCTLTTLDLQTNDVGNYGAKYICEALKINKSLTALDLQRNNIEDHGARFLCEALQINNTLTTLQLACNNIGEAICAQIRATRSYSSRKPHH